MFLSNRQSENMLPTWYKFLLKNLYYLLQVFGLFLPTDFINVVENEYKSTKIKQVYAVFLATLLVSSYSYQTWHSVTTIFKVSRTSSIILILLLYSPLTIISVSSILGNVFWNRANWFHYMKLQKMLKEKLHPKQKNKRNKNNFALELLLGHFVFIIVCVIDQWRHWLFSNGDLWQIISIALKDATLYYIFLLTLIIYNIALFLRYDFTQVKTFLVDTVTTENDKNKFTLCKPIGTDLVFPRLVVNDSTLYRFMETAKILNILFECVDIVNRIFGAVILLMNFATVAAILTALNILLITGETNVLTVDIVLNCLSEALTFTLWNSFIISACGLLKREAKSVVKLCCKLQHLLPQSSPERHELLNLAHQINRKSPTISAFGFFEVDFPLIFSVFNYVGTYIVVLIQFSYMDF